MEERLKQELEGLAWLVEHCLGSKAPTMVETIVRAKAMLENSDWTRRADKKKRRSCETGK